MLMTDERVKKYKSVRMYIVNACPHVRKEGEKEADSQRRG